MEKINYIIELLLVLIGALLISLSLFLFSDIGLFFCVIAFIFFILFYWMLKLVIKKWKKIAAYFHTKFSEVNNLEKALFNYWRKGIGLQKKYNFFNKKKRPKWYLVLGDDESAKENFLDYCQLPEMKNSKNKYKKHSSYIGKWYFFKNAMYFLLSEKVLCSTAWKKLIRKITKINAPSGVLICLSVEQLTNNSDYYKNARLMRDYLSPLLLRLGQRLPVYIILTKLEKLTGGDDWLSAVPNHLWYQAIGINYGYKEKKQSINQKVSHAIDCLHHALKKIRFLLLAKKETLYSVSTLAVPEEMVAIKPGLSLYLDGLFSKDHYSERGLLAGIFLTAYQENETLNQRVSLFTHDLLDSVLVNDEKQWPITYLWSKSLFNKIMLSVLIIVFIVMGLWGAFGRVTKHITLVDDITDSRLIDQQYNRLITEDNDFDNNVFHWIFYLPLNAFKQDTLKKYLLAAQPIAVSPGKFAENIVAHFFAGDDQQKKKIIINWVNFINIEKAIHKGSSLNQVLAMPTFSINELTGKKNGLTDRQYIAERFAEYHIDHKDDNMILWQKNLTTMLNADPSWEWLLSEKHLPDIHTIRLSDFFPEAFSHQDFLSKTLLPNIYSLAGEQKLNETIREINQASDNPKSYQWIEKNFLTDYMVQRQEQWLTFAGYLQLLNTTQYSQQYWHALLELETQGNSPYRQLLTFMNNDLSSVTDAHAQSWLILLRNIQRVISISKMVGFDNKLHLGKASIRNKLSSWLFNESGGFTFNKKMVDDYKGYNDLLNNLLLRVLFNNVQASKMSDNLLSDKEEYEINTLLNKFTAFSNNLSHDELKSGENDIIIKILQGDEKLLVQYAFLSKADELQKSWDTGIVNKFSRLSFHQTSFSQDSEWKLLHDDLLTFINGLNKYVTYSRDGNAQANSIIDIPFPFTKNMLDYMTELRLTHQYSQVDIKKKLLEEKEGLVQEQQSEGTEMEALTSAPLLLSVTSQPVTVNRDAALFPVGSDLNFICHDYEKKLVNLNFNRSDDFVWTPGACKQINILIHFPNFDLKKTYLGENAIALFIRDFLNGERAFIPDDFPNNKQVLLENNINKVLVRFDLSNSKAILDTQAEWVSLNNKYTETTEKIATLAKQSLNIDDVSDTKKIFIHLPDKIINGWSN